MASPQPLPNEPIRVLIIMAAINVRACELDHEKMPRSLGVLRAMVLTKTYEWRKGFFVFQARLGHLASPQAHADLTDGVTAALCSII